MRSEWVRKRAAVAGSIILTGLAIWAWRNVAALPAERPFTPEMADLWSRVGASVGRMRVGEDGRILFRPGGDGDPEPGDLLAFRFSRLDASPGACQRVARLPTPDQPFGLDLSLTAVTDGDLKDLAGLRNLRALNLGRGVGSQGDATAHPLLSEQGLAQLAPLQNLQALSLANRGKVNNVMVWELGKLPNLQVLDLSFTRISAVGMGELAKLRGLRTLNLQGTTSRDPWEMERPTGLQALAALTDLQSLNLRWTDATAADLQALASLPNLRSLDLRGCAQVTDAGLKELAPLQSLRSLKLGGDPAYRPGTEHPDHAGRDHAACRQITDVGMKGAAALRNLRTLALAGCWQVTDEGLRDLATLPRLQALDLRGCRGITAGGLKALVSLRGLQTLDLPPVTDDALVALGEIGLVQTLAGATAGTGPRPTSAAEVIALDLRSAPITDTGLKVLAGLPNLRALDLRDCPRVTEPGVRALQQALPGCSIRVGE